MCLPLSLLCSIPNASVSFRGRRIVMRTLVPVVGQLDWQAVSISYIDLLEHTVKRREELLRRYYFTCQCRRCQGKGLTWHPRPAAPATAQVAAELDMEGLIVHCTYTPSTLFGQEVDSYVRTLHNVRFELWVHT